MKSAKRTMKQRSHGTTRSTYPSNWTKIATATKDFARWRCVRCMHPHEKPWKHTKRDPVPCDLACRHEIKDKQRMLTVHHLDVVKSNVAWWNLAALCQVCHLQVQARVDWHQYYMLDHSHWMLPYLKGWALYQVTGMTVVNSDHADFTQYIGRPNASLRRKYNRPKHGFMELDNPWENPIRITADVGRAQAVAEYEPYIRSKIAEDPETYNLTTLAGHAVGCFCKPMACHGDVLIQLLADQILRTAVGRFDEFRAILAA